MVANTNTITYNTALLITIVKFYNIGHQLFIFLHKILKCVFVSFLLIPWTNICNFETNLFLPFIILNLRQRLIVPILF